MKSEHLYVSPCVRVDSFLHRGLHLVHQSLTHAGCSEEQQLVGLEALLNIRTGVRDPQSEQGIKLCRKLEVVVFMSAPHEAVAAEHNEKLQPKEARGRGHDLKTRVFFTFWTVMVIYHRISFVGRFVKASLKTAAKSCVHENSTNKRLEACTVQYAISELLFFPHSLW